MVGTRAGQVMTSRDMGVTIGIALFETVFSAAIQGGTSLHQASSQTIALGFHKAASLGVAASLIALVIASIMPCQNAKTEKSLTR